MRPDAARARAIIEAWREQQADRLDPIRFRFIDALERRAASHDGAARRLLDQRLSGLLGRYAEDLAATDISAENTVDGRPPAGPLAELLDHIAQQASMRAGDAGVVDVGAEPSAPADMAVLGEVRKLWSEVRSRSQLRQSLAAVPTDAGPLNAGALVHRSLALMHALSPGYLRHFLAYVDGLSWLEQLGEGAAGKQPSRSTAPRKRSRKKSSS